MNRMVCKLRSEDGGGLLLIVLMILLILSVMGIATLYIASQHGESAIRTRQGRQALYAAEGGVNFGMQQVAANPAIIQQGFETQGFNATSPNPDLILGGYESTLGGQFPAQSAVQIGPAPDPLGNTIACGLVGFSEDMGALRFRVLSRGWGPNRTLKEVEAHAALPPRKGMCPPGRTVVGGYAGG